MGYTIPHRTRIHHHHTATAVDIPIGPVPFSFSHSSTTYYMFLLPFIFPFISILFLLPPPHMHSPYLLFFPTHPLPPPHLFTISYLPFTFPPFYYYFCCLYLFFCVIHVGRFAFRCLHPLPAPATLHYFHSNFSAVLRTLSHLPHTHYACDSAHSLALYHYPTHVLRFLLGFHGSDTFTCTFPYACLPANYHCIWFIHHTGHTCLHSKFPATHTAS